MFQHFFVIESNNIKNTRINLVFFITFHIVAYMNKEVFHFVWLDLETTGLNTKTDTIIEIAMVEFFVEKDIQWLHTTIWESKSYLINPGRKIEDNISFITWIDNSMVSESPLFETIKEEVQNFIWDKIVVGHNVLFDIAMLESHWINTRKDVICDTFEFSEMLFQDCESLNLSFLASQFWFNNWGEHRALDDTIMSIRLFVHILGEIKKLSQEKKDIFIKIGENFQFQTFLFITSLLNLKKKNAELIQYNTFKNISSNSTYLELENRHISPITKQRFFSLGVNQENEDTLLQEENIENNQIMLIVRNKNTLEYFKTKFWDQSFIYHDDGDYLDLERFLFDCNKKNIEITSRKKVILLCKVAFWLQTTKTGNLWELKFYWDEYLYIRKYRSIQWEQSFFQQRKSEEMKQSHFILTTHKDYLKNKAVMEDTGCSVFIRDLFELEGSLTEDASIHIHFQIFHEFSEIIEWLWMDQSMIERYILALSIIEQIITKTARNNENTTRETETQEDTYFINQKELWWNGMWEFKESHLLLKNIYNIIIELLTPEIQWEYSFILREVEKNLKNLDKVVYVYQENTSFIINIYWGKLSLHLIPQYLNNPLEKLWNHVFYDFNISNPLQESFLKKQLWIQNIIQYKSDKDVQVIKYIDIKSLPSKFPKEWKILILTTNMKDSQRFLKELTTRFPEDVVFCQWISGGKSKIVSLVEKSEKSRIFIIGTCEYWWSDYSILKQVSSLIITKIPFYPPNDTQFLAKTHGMKNSFRDYSLPIAIQWIKTIIRNYILYSGNTNIFITDERLLLSEWWEIARNEIIKQ